VVKPAPRPLTADSIFDVASLTKVVATTTPILQLQEAGKIDISAPASNYWPELARVDDGTITIRDLLDHHSGLAADLDLSHEWSGYEAAMAMILAQGPRIRPGNTYRYSDINFEILGEIVRHVSGQPLDRYCRDHIFLPLGMHNTLFQPSPLLRYRIAPTSGTSGKVYWGVVHDATARRMGGLAGHAGLFSTADDLAAFARALLNRGGSHGAFVLTPASIEAMSRDQSPPGSSRARGLGWDVGGPRGEAIFPAGSFGHFGYTGTMIWINPVKDIFAIVLSHRVYPTGKGDAEPLRREILEIVQRAIEQSH
jgi:CubicO group peptidase (beta-lactamase class C family)